MRYTLSEIFESAGPEAALRTMSRKPETVTRFVTYVDILTCLSGQPIPSCYHSEPDAHNQMELVLDIIKIDGTRGNYYELIRGWIGQYEQDCEITATQECTIGPEVGLWVEAENMVPDGATERLAQYHAKNDAFKGRAALAETEVELEHWKDRYSKLQDSIDPLIEEHEMWSSKYGYLIENNQRLDADVVTLRRELMEQKKVVIELQSLLQMQQSNEGE